MHRATSSPSCWALGDRSSKGPLKTRQPSWLMNCIRKRDMTVPWTACQSGLDDPRVSAVLTDIFSLAERNDSVVMDHAYSKVATWSTAPTIPQMTELCREAALPVRREIGHLLYMLVRMLGATKVVEFGTSFGASLIYLAAAIRDHGTGG